MNEGPNSRYILGQRVDATTCVDATAAILRWAWAGESRVVAVSNVHMTMEGYDDPTFRQIVNQADLVTPDGMPLVWALRLLGVRGAERVDGSTLTLHVCEAASQAGLPIALYGGAEETLAAFTVFIRRKFPNIRIAAAIAPPFGPIPPDDDVRHVQKMIDEGARIVLVALGCPKQERWMHAHRGRLPAVMIGIGAALDFHAGRIPRAPRWMQRSGLEWFFRLLWEPRRLWRRYLIHNPRFVFLFLLQLLRLRRFPVS